MCAKGIRNPHIADPLRLRSLIPGWGEIIEDYGFAEPLIVKIYCQPFHGIVDRRRDAGARLAYLHLPSLESTEKLRLQSADLRRSCTNVRHAGPIRIEAGTQVKQARPSQRYSVCSHDIQTVRSGIRRISAEFCGN